MEDFGPLGFKIFHFFCLECFYFMVNTFFFRQNPQNRIYFFLN